MGGNRSSYEAIPLDPWVEALVCYEKWTNWLTDGSRPRPELFKKAGILEPFKKYIPDTASEDQIIEALEDAVGFPPRTAWVKKCLDFVWTKQAKLAKIKFSPLQGEVYDIWAEAFRLFQASPHVHDIVHPEIMILFKRHNDWDALEGMAKRLPRVILAQTLKGAVIAAGERPQSNRD